MDRSAAYRQVVALCLLNAASVVDRFHAVKRVGEARDGVRLRLPRHHGGERRQQLSRRRGALLKAPSDLTEEEHRDLAARFTAARELRRAWLQYQAFRAWFDLPDRGGTLGPLGRPPPHRTAPMVARSSWPCSPKGRCWTAGASRC